MCGIFGIYNIDQSRSFDQERFESSLLKMIHRGPDSHHIKIFGEKAILGHVRLSIIDLSPENSQPFSIDDRYWITYNGEIYNYVELRAELIVAGYKFRTSGDTEVIIRAFQYWGEECVTRFNGMWAFAIYDNITNILFCSRDRFGVKPFFYSLVNGQFAFSSEIKSLIAYFPQLKKPNYPIISNYCRKSTGAQTRETWFKEIFRLEPAFNMIVDNSGIREYRYWNYPQKVDPSISFETAEKKYLELLTDSIRIRMRSDVPVGFTLSSGIDSSSIVCLLKGQFTGNKNTYTAAYSDLEFHRSEKQNFIQDIIINEPELVRELTDELDLTPHLIEIRYSNYIEDLISIVRSLENGNGSPAVFPLYKILDEAKRDVTVVLEGQGADELLGGYIVDIFPVHFISLIKRLRFVAAFKELKSYMKVYSLKMAAMIHVRESDFKLAKKLFYIVSGIESFFKGELKEFSEISDYPNEPLGFDDKVNEHLFKAHSGCLVSLLHYGDAISMSHSIEARQPFMDYRLVEFVFTLPGDFKVHNGLGKYLHRKALNGIVPDYILSNPVKLGFDSPLTELFIRDDERSARNILLSDRCIGRGLFSKKALTKAFKEIEDRKSDRSRLLFRMLIVELWFREFIDESLSDPYQK